MNCPVCGKGGDVIDSRPTADGQRRRRECLNGHRFTTVELPLADAIAFKRVRSIMEKV